MRTPSWTGEHGLSPREHKGPRIYDHYWPEDEIAKALPLEIVYKGTLRFNMDNRKEAFVRIPGFTVEVLVVGLDQNRALEGDTVALRLYPYAKWPKYRPPTHRQYASAVRGPHRLYSCSSCRLQMMNSTHRHLRRNQFARQDSSLSKKRAEAPLMK